MCWFFFSHSLSVIHYIYFAILYHTFICEYVFSFSLHRIYPHLSIEFCLWRVLCSNIHFSLSSHISMINWNNFTSIFHSIQDDMKKQLQRNGKVSMKLLKLVWMKNDMPFFQRLNVNHHYLNCNYQLLIQQTQHVNAANYLRLNFCKRAHSQVSFILSRSFLCFFPIVSAGLSICVNLFPFWLSTFFIVMELYPFHIDIHKHLQAIIIGG